MFCPKCGANLPDNSVFCSNCGASINASGSPVPQQAPVQQQTPVQQQAPVQYQTIVKKVIVQPKAQAGMAVGLLAALTAFLGMISITGVIILAAYVFLKEDDLWLRKAVVRILAVIALFGLFSGLLNVFFDVFRMINNSISVFKYPVEVLTQITSFEAIIGYVIDGIEAIFLFVLGIKALSMSYIRIPIVDGLIDKHMS